MEWVVLLEEAVVTIPLLQQQEAGVVQPLQCRLQ
jgi:hypothetical protein